MGGRGVTPHGYWDVCYLGLGGGWRGRGQVQRGAELGGSLPPAPHGTLRQSVYEARGGGGVKGREGEGERERQT